MNADKQLFVAKMVAPLIKTKRALLYLLKECASLAHSTTITRYNLYANSHIPFRKLEIGSGTARIPGFETLNIRYGSNVDYVLDCAKSLPFQTGTFQLIYASHVFEHVPWYKSLETLTEWVRVLKRGGDIEIWVPDGLKVIDILNHAELEDINKTTYDGWYKFNDEKDPFIWANGRIFSYGDGTGRKSDPNWHLALFTPKHLQNLMRKAGLVNIQALESKDVRGYDHGWINLGMRGRKP